MTIICSVSALRQATTGLPTARAEIISPLVGRPILLFASDKFKAHFNAFVTVLTEPPPAFSRGKAFSIEFFPTKWNLISSCVKLPPL